MTEIDAWLDRLGDWNQHSITVTFEEFKKLPQINRYLFRVDNQYEGRTLFACNKVLSRDVNGIFTVYLFGVLNNGENVVIKVDDFEPFFDIRLNGYDYNSILSCFRSIKQQSRSPADIRIETIYAQPGDRYYPEPIKIFRVFIRSQELLNALHRKCANMGETYNNSLYNDALSGLFLRVKSIQVGRWIELKEIVRLTYEHPVVHHYHSKVNDICPTEIDIRNDPSISIAWDIETYTPNVGVPVATDPQAFANVACYDIFWHYSDRPLLTIAVTMHLPAKPLPGNVLIVHCPERRHVVFMHSYIIERFAPSFMYGFADHQYDWPFMIHSMNRILLPCNDTASIANNTQVSTIRNYKKMQYSDALKIDHLKTEQNFITEMEKCFDFKIDAETSRQVRYLPIDGCILIDMQLILMRKFPREEVAPGKSLNFFAKLVLQWNTKDDLSIGSPDPAIVKEGDNYAELRRIVSSYLLDSNDNARIGDLISYCITDSRLCHLMAKKIDMITEFRVITLDTYQSLDISINRAGGAKVRSTILYHAMHTAPKLVGGQVVFDTQKKHEKPLGKYEGAYVAKPIFGLEHMTCVIALDVNSLYPSIIINANLCPTKLIFGSYLDRVKTVDKLGWDNINQIDFDYLGDEYYVWTVKHHGDESQFGIFPTILLRLFNDRIIAKKIAELYGNFEYALISAKSESEVIAQIDKFAAEKYAPQVAEKMQWIIAEARARTSDLQALIDFVHFYAVLAHNTQNSKKVLMNTFYGAAGSYMNFMYNLYIAAAVTAYGRKTIIQMQKFAQSHNYLVRYGDTDSMYIHRPTDYYAEQLYELKNRLIDINDIAHSGEPIDILTEYRAAFKRYYHHVISEEIKAAHKLKTAINDEQRRIDGGKTYISIAFEEAGLPFIFLGKKTYMLLKHMSKPELDHDIQNVADEKLDKYILIKGLDMIKRGFSPIVKSFSVGVVKKIMDPFSPEIMFNTPILQIVRREIIRIYKEYDWSDIGQFTKTVTYKPNVQNVSVQEFVARLRLRQKTNPASYVPNAGDKFKIIRVRTAESQSSVDVYGKRHTPRASESFELPSVAVLEGMELDKEYYLDTELINSISKIIGYAFVNNVDPMQDYDTWRKEIVKEARKWTKEIYKNDCGLYGVEETSREGNTYMRALIKAANINDINDYVKTGKPAKILASMYDTLANGQHFRSGEFNPRVIAFSGISARDIPSKVEVSYDMTVLASPSELASIEQKLDDIISSVRAAYRSLDNFIIKCRQSKVAHHEVVRAIDQSADYDRIIEYLSLLDSIRNINAMNVRRSSQLID